VAAGVAVAVVLAALVGWFYWLERQPASAPNRPAPATALTLPNEPSIAILPFQNLSAKTDEDWFSDGIAETLITDLSRLKNLFVIARNSTFTYKGKPVDVRQVGRELGVRYVLEGSVQRTTDRLRINVQLVETQTGKRLWAERYDRKLDDVFAIQDDITQTS
jgi:adenylate cyclase